MNLLADHCVAALTKKFHLENIWFLNARTTPGCELPIEKNLIVVVAETEDALKVQDDVNANLRGLALESELGVHVFPASVIRTWPRPMLVKMAFSHGEPLYQFHPAQAAA